MTDAVSGTMQHRFVQLRNDLSTTISVARQCSGKQGITLASNSREGFAAVISTCPGDADGRAEQLLYGDVYKMGLFIPMLTPIENNTRAYAP